MAVPCNRKPIPRRILIFGLGIKVGKSRKQWRTAMQMHADLVALGYDGSTTALRPSRGPERPTVAARFAPRSVARVKSIDYEGFPPRDKLSTSCVIWPPLCRHAGGMVALRWRRSRVSLEGSSKLTSNSSRGAIILTRTPLA